MQILKSIWGKLSSFMVPYTSSKKTWEGYRAHIERRFGIIVALLIMLLVPSWIFLDTLLLPEMNLRWFFLWRSISSLVALITLFVLFRSSQRLLWIAFSWINVFTCSLVSACVTVLMLKHAPQFFWAYVLGYSTLFWALTLLLPFSFFLAMLFCGASIALLFLLGFIYKELLFNQTGAAALAYLVALIISYLIA